MLIVRITNLRHFSVSTQLNHLMKLTRVNVVDNSVLGIKARKIGRPAKIIQVYKKTGIGLLGDKVLLAICGEKKKAIIVGVRQDQKLMKPRHDTNNVVLINEDGSPIGNRVTAPLPSFFRKEPRKYSKILSIASNIV
ncbi:39S ribosomal protein L14, mitochondrial [Intoshia linei]|uniref:Large ribosomal subunit protein uL14m n=1 Tax=Intoshia linei TaxID=1819745 RepID=A0A177B9C5_9BILA|nr:39S ribosomal protein L14, mitochondrial [Intoshia linei]